MKNTGLVRRVDNLGRIVVPKEIRKRMLIREDDPMEIFIEDGRVILKKHSPMTELADVRFMLNGFYKTLKCPIIICDRDKVIQIIRGPKEIAKGTPVTPEFFERMENRQVEIYSGGESLLYPFANVASHSLIAQPIITASGDYYGYVILLAIQSNTETAEKQMLVGAKMIADAIAEYLDV